MTHDEATALRTLLEQPRGLYGSDVVKIAAGKLSVTAAYTALDSLGVQELLREIPDEPATPGMLPRIRHQVTERGRLALAAFEQQPRAAACA